MDLKGSFKIAFISGKLGDVDGVSLEVDKWIEQMQALGHDIYTIAGSYRNPVINISEKNQLTLPEICFDSPIQKECEQKVFPYISSDNFFAPVSEREKETYETYLWEEGIKTARKIRDFVYENDIDLLVGENTNAMPMTMMGGIATYMMAVDLNMATLFHHHDFWWERSRFCDNHVEKLLDRIMPPITPGVEHAVISSYAAHILRTLKRVEPTVVPNCEDFGNPPEKDDYNNNFRKDFGFKDDDILVVQPTRIVPRKRIEDSILFISAFIERYPEYRDKIKFIISLYGGDEDPAYPEQIKHLCEEKSIPLYLIADRVSAVRGTNEKGERIYTNRDVLVQSDVAIYLPIWEGFGNALLEAIAAKLLTVVSTYLIYKTDIKGIGLRGVEVRDTYDKETGNLLFEEKVFQDFHKILNDPVLKEHIIENNFKVASEEFGYDALKRILGTILDDYGAEILASRRRIKKYRHIFSV